jgi:type IV pilus assembly protein PilY1
MSKMLTGAIFGWMVLLAAVPGALATANPDQYPGDSAIYGVQAPLQPNVLIIIDDSTSMSDSVLAADYDSTITYTPVGTKCSGNYCCQDTSGNAAECVANNIYLISTDTDQAANSELFYTSSTGSGNHIRYTYTPSTLSQISTTLKCGTGSSSIYPNASLTDNGTYSGYALTPGASSITCGTAGSTIYATGNYITYLNTPLSGLTPKYLVAQSVVKTLINSSDNVKFGLMTYGKSQIGGKLLSTTPAWSMVTGHTSGTAYTTFAQKMDAQFPAGYVVKNTAKNTPCNGPINTVCTNRDALTAAIATLNGSSGGTPIGQVLVEAGRTFCGCDASGNNCGVSPYGNTVGTGTGTGYCSSSTTSYVSPIDAPCQKNYIVLVTDGMSTLDNQDLTSPGILAGYCPSPGNNGSSSTTGACATDGCGCCFNNAAGACTYSGSTGGSCNKGANYQCAAYPNGNSGLGIDNASTQVTKALYGSTQNISTFAIGFDLGSDAAAIGMLTTATDKTHGHGAYYSASTQTALSVAFSQIMAQIYQVNSSYVAPVVPSSPQNRTYSGDRIYMGFFEPQQNTTWFGNLKKYGIGNFTYSSKSYNNVITDATGVPATWLDLNSDSKDDIYGTNLTPLGASNGSFKSTSTIKAQSFWSAVADGASVNSGGAGSMLEGLSSATSRTIYTQTLAGGSLVTFNSTNVTPGLLGYATGDTTDATNLINFTYGQDVLNEAAGGTTNRPWMLADVLHSQPLVINYKSYTLCDPCQGDTCVCSTGPNATCVNNLPVPNNCTSATPTANETSPTVNKTYIFVGGNDGMLHAFRDYNGSEAWSFIPYEFLPNLKNNLLMVDTTATQPHNYFADGTVSKYIYNSKSDGNINSSTDKVILLFGTRRGVGNATAPTTGAYYALNASTVADASSNAPSLLWSINQSTSGFSELAESWSNPNIVTMKVNGAVKVVAVFGAGYDNPNEDGRFGATQYFQGNSAGSAASATGQGTNTSAVATSGSAPYSASAKGRGIYLVEIATLTGGVGGAPSFTNSGKLIWSYTYGATTTSTATAKTDPAMIYSIPSDVTAWDNDGDGLADRFYVGDMGGNIWRFNVSDPADSTKWSGARIFQSNPCTGTACSDGTGDVGRKIFYKPSALRGPGYVSLFFGTGDREHPTNTAVDDRIYAMKDPLDIALPTPSGSSVTLPMTESNLMDVTLDTLQAAGTSAATAGSLLSQLNGITALSGSTYAYGWYIKLSGTTTTANSGEKVLAPPVVFNGDATFNTYTPTAAGGSTNSCTANLGTAIQYDLNYLTGEAIINKSVADDTSATDNVRSLYNKSNSAGLTGTYSGIGNSGVLQVTDRGQVIGTGIPSGTVELITAGGQIEALTGGGGSIITGAKTPGGALLHLYWRQK